MRPLLLFLGIALFGASGHSQTILSLRPFDEISVTGNIDVTLIPGTTEAAKLTVVNIPEDKVTIKVVGGKLRIRVLESIFYKDEDIRVEVTYRELREIRTDAGAHLSGAEAVGGDQLLLRAGSGSRIDLAVHVRSIDGGASEGGLLELSGTTERQEANASTGGRYLAFDLTCPRTYAHASTGGEVQVQASEYLEASANTSGAIFYQGEPREVNSSTALSGKVEKY